MIQTIPYANLALAFIPVFVVIGIIGRWHLGYRGTFYAVARMLIQLLLIGYALTFIFKTENVWVVLLVLSVMLASASWIALRTMHIPRKTLYLKSLGAVFLGGGATLLLMSQVVLELDPWYLPRYIIPLAGMIFASSMNSISLAGERLEAEMGRDLDYLDARSIALKASLIPITNSLFAVGLVSLPGMMTGQILSGTSPMIAVRYQIMVMCMIFGASGLSASLFLVWIRHHVSNEK
jgi:putative ABC transport system permease protein